MNRCECLLAGMCSRHMVKKSARMLALCQSNADYWNAWEEGRGPGQIQSVEREHPPTAEYNHWAPLHFYAVKQRDKWDAEAAKLWYFGEWVAKIPKSCGCKEKWIQLDLAPDFSSAEAFFNWANESHNLVNNQLGKTLQPTLEQAKQIWGFSLT